MSEGKVGVEGDRVSEGGRQSEGMSEEDQDEKPRKSGQNKRHQT